MPNRRVGQHVPDMLLRHYRATGADLPFGDPRGYHGVAMEGYFWRFTQRGTGRVVIALCGVSCAADGPWGLVALAGHPSGFQREGYVARADADRRRLGVRAGSALIADEGRLRVDLGPDARLDVKLDEVQGFAPRPFGGVGVAHVIPGLSQYWHPHVVGGRVSGRAVLGDEEIDLDGADVYAEKNWGRGGFPDAWWWGQAQGFERRDVCVAFAGGDVRIGPVKLQATALVVRLGDRIVRLGNPVVSPVRAQIADERWHLAGRSPGGWSVDVEGDGRLATAHVLPVPLPEERRMVPGAVEHLGATLDVVVRRRGRVVFSGTSELAGLEDGGVEPASAELLRRDRSEPQAVA